MKNRLLVCRGCFLSLWCDVNRLNPSSGVGTLMMILLEKEIVTPEELMNTSGETWLPLDIVKNKADVQEHHVRDGIIEGVTDNYKIVLTDPEPEEE